MALVRRRVIVSGRVQGVFFRQSCADRARAAGVTGWIRNRPDGRVEAVFQGDAVGVEQLVAWCRAGPPHALVNDLEVSDEPVDPGEETFGVTGSDE